MWTRWLCRPTNWGCDAERGRRGKWAQPLWCTEREKRNVSTATVMQREKRNVSTATVMQRQKRNVSTATVMQRQKKVSTATVMHREKNVSTATVMHREKNVSTATVMQSKERRGMWAQPLWCREREEKCKHSHCDAQREKRNVSTATVMHRERRGMWAQPLWCRAKRNRNVSTATVMQREGEECSYLHLPPASSWGGGHRQRPPAQPSVTPCSDEAPPSPSRTSCGSCRQCLLPEKKLAVITPKRQSQHQEP